ncbi:phage fiber-tail adaptor protein [Terrabacter terrigena]|uniref:Uncharacterized protein n=1 Tax=Terrabacter terrigena TaxID=574718 RepID=A0ABW3N0T9_9MICO
MEKDPQAKLDYAVDWTAWLQPSETITTSTWTVPAGLTKASSPAESVVGGKATVWLSGGTAGTRYDVTNHIITNQGREDERTLVILVNDR